MLIPYGVLYIKSHTIIIIINNKTILTSLWYCKCQLFRVGTVQVKTSIGPKHRRSKHAGRNNVLHYINSFVSSINTKILFFIFSEYVWNILNLVKVKKKSYVIYFEKYDEACFRYETYAQIFWLANPTADVYFFFPDREYSMYLTKQELTSSKYE